MMAASGLSTWPALNPGSKARGSEVERKFDWLEGSIFPMQNGSTTTGVWDMGTSTSRWRDLYAPSVRFTTFTAYASATAAMSIASSGIVSWSLQSQARVFLSAAQTLTSGAATKVQFNTESYDNRSEYDNTVNYRFTATRAGRYLVNSRVTISQHLGNADDTVAIYVNGILNAAFTQRAGVDTTGGSLFIENILNLAANDYVEIFATVGDTLTTINAGTDASVLAVQKVS